MEGSLSPFQISISDSLLPLSIHHSHQFLFDLPLRHHGVIGEEPSGLAALLLSSSKVVPGGKVVHWGK